MVMLDFASERKEVQIVKKRMGRPPKENPRKITIGISVNEEEQALIEKAIELENWPDYQAKWARVKLLEVAKKIVEKKSAKK